MKSKLLFCAVGSVSCLASPAAAMNWCSLPQITPEISSDFERIAPSVERLTGCERQPSDSAHQASWVCKDDPSTAEINEYTTINFLRDPGVSTNLIIMTSGVSNLDMIRSCGIRDIRNDDNFEAGNVAHRDRVQLGRYGPRITLSSILPDYQVAIFSDHKRSSGEDDTVRAYTRGVFGITTRVYPSTNVKFAGLNPITNDVYSIVSAYEARGANVLEATNIGESLPVWRLSPPVGLGGVSSIEIKGFVRHFLRVDYNLASTADYERFIGLLDSEYGRSERNRSDGCTYRWWSSRDVSIRGEHCPGISDQLTFYNDVSGEQLSQFSTRIEEDSTRLTESDDEPAIDSDMF